MLPSRRFSVTLSYNCVDLCSTQCLFYLSNAVGRFPSHWTSLPVSGMLPSYTSSSLPTLHRIYRHILRHVLKKRKKFHVITTQLCIFFLMRPTRCTLLLSIFISTSLHVSGNYVPIIRKTYCIYATLVFFSLYGWLSGLQNRQPPIHSEKYQCRIDTVSFHDDGHVFARNMYRSCSTDQKATNTE